MAFHQAQVCLLINLYLIDVFVYNSLPVVFRRRGDWDRRRDSPRDRDMNDRRRDERDRRDRNQDRDRDRRDRDESRNGDSYDR